MRIAGGQEIGMACDFTIAQDLARFGQAGPKHGSAPDGGSTDFLQLFVGVERAFYSCTVCDPWSAHEALRFGLITEIVPALKVNGEFIPNPMVNTNKWVNEKGELIYGTPKRGEEKMNECGKCPVRDDINYYQPECNDCGLRRKLHDNVSNSLL